MTWIKLDDNAPRHPKISGLSDRAFRWWILALCYASEFLTDGVLPANFWKQTPKAARAELSASGLWVWTDPVFQIHDYLKHQQSREVVEAERRRQRDRRKGERGTPERRTAGTNTTTTDEIPRPPIEVEKETEKEKNTVPPAPAKSLVSGQAHPRNWGNIHGNHIAGFCDWVCLPEFVFEEFLGKSPGPEYVMGWARQVREQYQGTMIGEDSLKFWRARWSESHVTPRMTPKPRGVAELVAEEEARKKALVS